MGLEMGGNRLTISCFRTLISAKLLGACLTSGWEGGGGMVVPMGRPKVRGVIGGMHVSSRRKPSAADKDLSEEWRWRKIMDE